MVRPDHVVPSWRQGRRWPRDHHQVCQCVIWRAVRLRRHVRSGYGDFGLFCTILLHISVAPHPKRTALCTLRRACLCLLDADWSLQSVGVTNSHLQARAATPRVRVRTSKMPGTRHPARSMSGLWPVGPRPGTVTSAEPPRPATAGATEKMATLTLLGGSSTLPNVRTVFFSFSALPVPAICGAVF